MPFTPATRSEASLVMPASSRATVRVTGAAVISLAVMETPGSRSAKVLVADVTVCAAPVPGHSVDLGVLRSP